MEDNPTHESQIHVDLDNEPAAVWDAITTDAGFEAWMGEGASIDARPGGDLTAPDPASGVERSGRVDSVDDGRELRYHWWPTSESDAPSSVTIHLEPLERGTRLTIIERPAESETIGTRLMASTKSSAAWQWRSAMLCVSMRLRVAA